MQFRVHVLLKNLQRLHELRFLPALVPQLLQLFQWDCSEMHSWSPIRLEFISLLQHCWSTSNWPHDLSTQTFFFDTNCPLLHQLYSIPSSKTEPPFRHQNVVLYSWIRLRKSSVPSLCRCWLFDEKQFISECARQRILHKSTGVEVARMIIYIFQ